MLRKTVLATAIIGAGLGTMSGAALAHDHGGDASGCSNRVSAASENGAGRTLGDTTGGDQDLAADNTCDILNDNVIGSGNNTAGGDVVNGDTTDITTTETNTSTETTDTTIPADGTGGAGGLAGLDSILDAIFGAA